MEMTYLEYDMLLDRFDKVAVTTYYPKPNEFDLMEEQPDRWLKYLCFMYEKGRKPLTEEEKYSRKNMQEFIYRHLSLKDNE